MNWIVLILALLVASPAWTTNYCQDANVKACWTFSSENGSGTTLIDDSSNGNNGTFSSSGHPAWSTTTPNANIRYSVNYGTGDTITRTVDLLGGKTRVSLVMWIYPSSTTITPLNGGWSNSWLLTTDTSKPYFAANNLPSNHKAFKRATSYNWDTTKWQHLVVTFDSNTGASGTAGMYLNGSSSSLVISDLGSSWNTGETIGASTNFTIGGTGCGYMTQIAIFDRILSTTDISAIYDFGLTGQSLAGGKAILRNSIIRNSIIR